MKALPQRLTMAGSLSRFFGHLLVRKANKSAFKQLILLCFINLFCDFRNLTFFDLKALVFGSSG